MKKVTITDLAQIAGVSALAVSRYINCNEYVSEEKKAAIKKWCRLQLFIHRSMKQRVCLLARSSVKNRSARARCIYGISSVDTFILKKIALFGSPRFAERAWSIWTVLPSLYFRTKILHFVPDSGSAFKIVLY